MKHLPTGRIEFLLLKIHSLTGIFPIGFFLAFHLGFNTLRTVGVRQYQLGIDLINNAPFLLWIEIGFIYVPLLIHSILGFYVTRMASFNALRYNYPRNWLYTLQRITGAVVFLFLIYHMGTTVGPKMYYGKHQFEAAPYLIAAMNEQFGGWLGRILYLIGVTAATFHFANGLWGFCVSWGILIGRTAQRNAAILFMLVGLTLTLLGVAVVVEFSLHPQTVTPNSLG
jgi:succinate dehydrogenase / fumarate reductase cytochrome b subunit